MAFIPVPNAAQAQLVFSDDGQECINDLYFSYGATPTLAQLLQTATDLATWWLDDVSANICDIVTLQEVRVTDLGNQNGAQAAITPGTAGQVTSEQAPNNVAPCISFRTGFRGRSFRGRNYIAGVPNSEIAVNTLSNSWTAAMIAAYENLLAGGGALTVPGIAWVVVSRFTAGGPRTTGIFTDIVSVGFTDNIVDSQRRRLPGRGR